MTDERSNLLSFLSVRERMQTGGAGKAVSIVPEKYSWGPTLIKKDVAICLHFMRRREGI